MSGLGCPVTSFVKAVLSNQQFVENINVSCLNCTFSEHALVLARN